MVVGDLRLCLLAAQLADRFDASKRWRDPKKFEFIDQSTHGKEA